MKIFIVQSYPYEAVTGGDGAYIAALRDCLTSRHHDVYGLTSNMTRGRTSPVHHSRYDLSKLRSYKIRNSFRIFGYTISLKAIQIVKTVCRLLNRSCVEINTPVSSWSQEEAEWCETEMKKIGPDLVILISEATNFAIHFKKDYTILAAPIFLKIEDSLEKYRDEKSQISSIDFRAQFCDAISYIGLSSKRDIDYLYHHGVKNTLYLGFGIKLSALEVKYDSSWPIVLFVGAQTSSNKHSIEWFLERVWPLIAAKCKRSRLRIVGGVANVIDPILVSHDIDLIGYSNSIMHEYEQSQVVIAPLTVGSHGVKTKVAEALSYGRPVVTTSLGLDSLDPESMRRALFVCDTAEEFSHSVVSLLVSPELRRNKRVQSLQAFEANFSLNAAYGSLIEAFSL